MGERMPNADSYAILNHKNNRGLFIVQNAVCELRRKVKGWIKYTERKSLDYIYPFGHLKTQQVSTT